MTHRVFLLNPKKLLIVLLVVCSLAFFLVQQKTMRQTKAAGNAFYAATNGNDFKLGTESRPWKAIQRASNKMIAGDTTYVRGRTYDRNSGTLAETSSLIPAFPGAEGFGANSVGGRGGRVIEVTNLNDSGSGSLRACIEASGPRICVFRTGGTIELSSVLKVKNPYITIAGQTAPGGGITLKNRPSNGKAAPRIQSHDVIIRYIRSRPGSSTQDSGGLDAIEILDRAYNVVIDHCSFSWATDENVSTWRNPHDITIQWSIISEGLDCSTHPKGCHSKGLLFGSDGTYNISVHHNLLAHNVERSPRIKSSGLLDIVNNMIYNSGPSVITDDYAKVPVNYISNYYIPGGSHASDYYVHAISVGVSGFEIFAQGNICPSRTSNEVGEELVVSPGSRKWLVSTRHEVPSITTTSAFEAYEQILTGAGSTIGLDSQGNSYWRRDTVDERIVNDVINGTGRIIDDPSEVGGWPYLSAGTPYTDSDHDGMADDWELAHFGALDRGSPNDSSSDFDGDGYTDLEEYLNGTNPKHSRPTQIFLPFVSKSSLP